MTASPLGTVTAPAGVRRILSAPTTDLDDHHAAFGPVPRLSGKRIIAAVESAGLSGRGGAGFPTARKLRAVASGSRPVVVATATEGEPLSRKDAWLLANAPHLVLDGVVLAARAVGAGRGHVVTSSLELADAVRDAYAQRDDRIPIEVTVTSKRFVSGEESAVVSALNGGAGLPTDKLVPVYRRGVRGRPTLVNNVETLAHLALIARFGPSWFREVGTAEEPGTMLVTVSGAVRNPGLLEVPLGMSMTKVLDAAGADELSGVAAVLVGGFHGAWLPGSVLSAAELSRASLARWDATPGAGVLLALGRDECPLVRAGTIAGYLSDQSSGQCGPCVNGLPRLADALNRLARGDRPGAVPEEIAGLRRLVSGRGACSHPDGTARFIGSTMSVFYEEVAVHLAGGCSVQTSH